MCFSASANFIGGGVLGAIGVATITEVIQVSLRVVQVILRASARTSLANCGMLVFFLGWPEFLDWVWATAVGAFIAAAVFAARFLIACGLEPGFLAMAAFFKLVFVEPRTPRPRSLTGTYI